jgi:hypothetical protein
MSAISDDLMEIGRQTWIDALHDGTPDAAIIIAKAILSERQRTADLIEEVKRVLGPFATLSDNANNGQRYFLQLLVCPVGDKYGGDATDFGPKIRDAHALLSKLEGR